MRIFWNSVFGFVFLIYNINAANIQLNQKVKPKFYWIGIDALDFDVAEFKGTATIEIDAVDYFKTVTLHAKNLTIQEVTLSNTDGMKTKAEAKLDEENQLVTIQFNKLFLSGKYNLSISYKGIIHDDMTGFYRSYYYVGDDKRWLGATQFEATNARKAFPCFDEPKYRTGFNLSIKVDGSYRVISNTKLKSAESYAGYTTYNFASYPKMPSYLLGWIIYDPETFTSRAMSKDGIEYKVWAQKEYYNQTAFALNVAPVLLNSLVKYTGLDYKIEGEMEKMDQIAVPDFDAGAMENWGLVTYRESGLLYDEKLTSTETKRNILMVIAHEFTHQWFGNLNTLEWWSYIWLNEAFARFFQYFIPAKEYPEWKLDEQFVVNALQVALDFDSKPVHPMTSEITHHKNISAMFDTISYSKGASVVRMMEHTLTPEKFQKGLHTYLSAKKRSTQVSIPDDLFNLVSSVMSDEDNKNFNFKNVFKTWTEKSGFPLITVTRDYNKKSAFVEQKRFLYKHKKNDTTTWYVPLTYTSQAESNFNDVSIKQWMTPNDTSITIDNIAGDGWVIFNVQHKGFYRVNYDEENWMKIVEQLKNDHSKIGAVNRAQLIDDAYSLARAGEINHTVAFEITSYLRKETDYVPWVAAIRHFKHMLNHFHESPNYEKLTKYFLQLVSPIVSHVTFKESNTESVVTKLTRITVLSFASKVGHQEAESNAAKIAKDLASTMNTQFSADVQKALLCQGIKSTNISIWRKLFKQLEDLESPTQINDFIRALACTHDPEAITEYLNKTIDKDSVIRMQDDRTVFSGLASSPIGAKTVIKFVRNNYEQLIQFNNGKDEILSDLVRYASGYIYNRDDLEEIEGFLENMTSILTEGTIKSINSSISKIEENFEWRSKNWDDIVNWLREEETHTEAPTPSTTSTITTSKPANTTSKPSSANTMSSSFATFLIAGAVFFTITFKNHL
uniref:Aminopeptidase n=1 Tax=Nilaparvata lugens TaxID=108931 RepID=A0A2L1IQ84_NILLU|nr:putative APN-1 [Nilaparvata lugens]